MNGAEEVTHEIVTYLATEQRKAVWAYVGLPRWRFIARRRALAVAEAMSRVATEAVRKLSAYYMDKAARHRGPV